MKKELQLRRKTDAMEARNEFPLELPATDMPLRGMFTFRYASTEVFSQDGNVHVRMKRTQYHDGRLRTEECEGTLDSQAYERMVTEAQGYFLNQAFGFARLLLAPFIARPGRRD